MAVIYAGAEWIGPAFSENYLVGRQGNGISGIVVHHTAATLDSSIARFKSNSGISGGGTSAHFIIDLDGTRYQIVDTDDTAFHAGNFSANLTTVGIEHVQTWDFGNNVKTSDFTDAQYRSSHELCSILANDNGFPLDANRVRPHNYYSQTACPADLDINRILTAVGPPPPPPEEDMTPAQEAKLDGLIGAVGNLFNGAYYSAAPSGDPWAKIAHDQAMAQVAAIVKAIPPGGSGGTDLSPVLAAIADLKAHPAVGGDPALLALVQKIDAHFTGK